MRLNPWSVLIVGAMIISIPVAISQTSRLSSDGRGKGLPTPPTGTIFVPPSMEVFTVLTTNRIPLVVCDEVWSQTVMRVVWYQRGHRQTNDQLLASNLISTATNDLR
jgi:hypothetical protein